MGYNNNYGRNTWQSLSNLAGTAYAGYRAYNQGMEAGRQLVSTGRGLYNAYQRYSGYARNGSNSSTQQPARRNSLKFKSSRKQGTRQYRRTTAKRRNKMVRRVRKRRQRRRSKRRLNNRSITRLVRNVMDWTYVQQYTNMGSTQWSSAINEKGDHSHDIRSVSNLKSYVDSCNPTCVSGTTITWADITNESVVIQMLPSYAIFTIANNWGYNAHIDCYWMKCVDSTADNCKSLMDSAFDDILVDSSQAAVTDGENRLNWSYATIVNKNVGLNRYWRLRSHKKYNVPASGTVSISFPMDGCYVNAKAIDSGDSTYMKDVSYCLVTQTWGQVAHDLTSTSLVGYSDSTLDVVYRWRTKFRVKAANKRYKATLQAEVLGAVVDPEVVLPDISGYDNVDVPVDT